MTCVGVVAEIKPDERRVALTPAGARRLVRSGCDVVVQVGAGCGSGFDDDQYAVAGAQLQACADDVWQGADVMVKVKEPTPEEYRFLREDLILFTYLHLAAAPELTSALIEAGTTAIGYETVTDESGALPLLMPMSEIAGQLAAWAASSSMHAPAGGPGILIGGATGVSAARVLILGGGVVGENAARVALGMGAEVTVLEQSLARMRQLDAVFQGRVRLLFSDPETLATEAIRADAVIGAVLKPGAAAPKLLTRNLLSEMRNGSVLVDVAIDQGGCAETSRPTTHGTPTYTIDGVIHYCVTNMPGAVPVTATRALTDATYPYLEALAVRGADEALDADPGFADGLNVRGGAIVAPALKVVRMNQEPVSA